MINELNAHLPLEISAHLRYATHGQLFKYWGYSKLADRYQEAAEEEMGHAKAVEWRIMQLGGFPEYLPELVSEPQTKRDIKALLKADLDVEEQVLSSLTGLIDSAEGKAQDWETANTLRGMVTDTESDITWYTTQLTLIDEMGLQNWLQAQL